MPTLDPAVQCTQVRFASLLSGGFTAIAVINPPEKKPANRTSVEWTGKTIYFNFSSIFAIPALI